MISVVIPTFNAAAFLPHAFHSLFEAAIDGLVGEVIVSDGGSTDATRRIADDAGAKIVTAPQGRGQQLRTGAEAARRPWLLFLHADTRLGPGWEEDAKAFMACGADRAAAFRFKLADRGIRPRMLEGLVALRCRAFRLPYGDQGLLISRKLYDAVGGFAPIPLMEDVDIVRRLGRNRLVMLNAAAITSAERYRRDGYARRSMRNLGLLTLYLSGVSPERILRFYE